MAVKLSKKNETVTPEVEATPKVVGPLVADERKTVTLEGKKIIPTAGVFLISNPDKSFKYIGTSTRIEVCIKDYFKWLTDGKHGNSDMQAAFEANGKKLNWEILKVCDKAEFANEKARFSKELGVDMKVAFSKEVIKAADIVVEDQSASL